MKASAPRPNARPFAVYVGSRIRLAREMRGMTGAELAQRAHLPDQSVVTRYEKGQRKLSLLDARNIAESLGISVGALIEGAP